MGAGCNTMVRLHLFHVCHSLLSLKMSLLLVPRSTDSDGNRKVPLDTTHTRGKQWLPWLQTDWAHHIASIKQSYFFIVICSAIQ